MAERKERPGVMLYFDVFRPLLNRLDDKQCGQLLRMVIDYAEHGEVHDNLDPLLGMAFDLIRPKLDHDAERYEESREQRQYAVYCRKQRKAGEPILEITEWRLSRNVQQNIGPIYPDDESNGPIYLKSGSIGPYPSTSTAPATSTVPAIAPAPAISGESSGNGEVEEFKGEGAGANVIDLRNRWLYAKEKGDMTEALNLSNMLFRMGYNINPSTGELTERT